MPVRSEDDMYGVRQVCGVCGVCGVCVCGVCLCVCGVCLCVCVWCVCVCGIPLDLAAFSESNEHNSIRGFRCIKVDKEVPDNNVRNKHKVLGFWDFYGLIDSELQNVQEAGSDGWGLDRSSYNFFALMEKVDPYIGK